MKYLLIILFVLIGCNDDRPYQQRAQDAINADAVEVCVGNHVYYYINWGHSGLFAPKFGDDDKPIKCRIHPLLGPSPRATYNEKTKTWWSKCKVCNGTGKVEE